MYDDGGTEREEMTRNKEIERERGVRNEVERGYFSPFVNIKLNNKKK